MYVVEEIKTELLSYYDCILMSIYYLVCYWVLVMGLIVVVCLFIYFIKVEADTCIL